MPETVRSADGTTIAYDQVGSGPSVIAIGGAFNVRQSHAGLADVLAPNFTVYTYDRRGRGDSTDTEPYAVEREIEDLAALIDGAGGSAYVYGHSSGACLALEAASRGLPIPKLVVYEPPYATDEESESGDLSKDIQEAIDAGRPDQAAELFLGNMGPEVVEGVKQSPYWEGMVGVAHTLPYDMAVVGDGPPPVDRLADITAPTLVLAGGASPEWFHNAVSAVTTAIPGARAESIEGQDHDVADDVIAPKLVDFFEKRPPDFG